MTGRSGLNRGQQPELRDEALVIRGELPADARGEGVAQQLALQQSRGFPPPAPAFAEPREGAARHQLSRRFGDDVVVRRRAPALEPVQVPLVPADLLHREPIVLEQAGHAGPAIEQAPDPGQADQPDAHLDPAGPVHTGKEGVLLVPGPQLVRHPARVRLVTAQEPGRGQQREVLQAGDFPDLLDVADLLFRTLVDPERVTVRRGPAAGHRVAEPVGRHQVGPRDAEDLPFAAHEPVRRGQQRGAWPPRAPGRRYHRAARR